MNNKAEYTPEKVVDISNLSREDWLEYRKKGIGGSDVAAIMGISPFATIRDLFYNKTGVQPVIQEEEESNWVAKEVGHRLEDLVAEIFSKKTGLEVFPVRVMFRHPLYPFMLADVDFFVRMPDGTFAILECKTCNYNAKDKWADEGIPAHYVLQVRLECDFMGKKNPFVFTIGFDKSDPDHVYVTELLNTTEKKAKLIVAAILAYTGRTDETGNGSISMEPDMLRPMMQQIIREEVRKVLEGQDVSKINREMPTEVDLMEEEPLRMDQTMRQNVVDAISAFRRA